MPLSTTAFRDCVARDQYFLKNSCDTSSIVLSVRFFTDLHSSTITLLKHTVQSILDFTQCVVSVAEHPQARTGIE